MSEQHRELIKKCQAQFIQAIVDTQCLGPLIYQLSSRDESGDSALTLQDTISIAVEYTNEAEKVRAVLEILCTRGPNAIDRFFKAIVDNKQSRLISVLTSQWPPNRQTGNERTSDHSSAPVPSNTRICSFDPNSSVQVGHVQDGTQHNYRAQGSIYSDDASEQRYAQDNRNNQGFQNNGPVSGGRFDQKIIYGANAEGCTINNQNIQGSMMGGPVRGGIVNIGDHHYYQQELRQVPSTSSIPSQPSTEDWQKKLETAQQSLKHMYLTRFEKVYPFSLPFTFDIDNTWVSLALKEEKKDSQATEDHAELLKRAFEKVKMLIIEGDPATGKTSLMRRLAYEWANGKQGLLHYDLLLYAEFREVREKTFKSITNLVLGGLEEYLTTEGYENLKKLVNNEQYCKECRILVLLDGYDESSLEKQCSEFSSYMKDKTSKKPLRFHTVITTRKGYLSNLKGREGRFVFAEVLGFTTKQQKEKYIHSHFHSSEIDNKHNIAAVCSLLDINKNLNKLAETPLFLTFICLVHERIVYGTLLELYCNIIWWLIDRHQQDFPDRDIPALFGFHNGSSDKFKTIQEHYTQFSQFLCLGKMALARLKDNVFGEADYVQFNLEPIIEQVGLLRKQVVRNESLQLKTSFFFPHRTIQEFLAAFNCLSSDDSTSEWLSSNSKLDTRERGMNEFERFLFRFALSDKMPIQAEKRKYYFERITEIRLDMTFDAFNTTAGFNNELLNWFLSQCTNVQDITLTALNNARHEKNMLNDASAHSESAITSKLSNPTVLSFSDLIKLHSLTFGGKYSGGCTFSANSQLSFTNCPSLKNLKFNQCELKSSTIVGIATLPAIDTVQFDRCSIDLATWQAITDQIGNSNVKYFKLIFGDDFKKEFLIHLQQCNSTKEMDITVQGYTIRQNDLLSFSDLLKLHSLTLTVCIFSANSQLSFTNCPSLKNLKFHKCELKSSTIVGIAALPAIDTVQFDRCSIDLATWQAITDQIGNSNVKYFKLIFGDDFKKEFLIHLQKCNNLTEMDIKIQYYTVRQNDLLSFSHLIKLYSLTFSRCTFSASSQLLFTNCPSLRNIKFFQCEMKSSTIVGIATLPAIDTVLFYECNIDLATWQSITHQIRNSNVKYFKLIFGKYSRGKEEDFNKDFLIYLHQCSNVEQMEITIRGYTLSQNEELSFSHLIRLHSLTFSGCTFLANSQLSFTNCPSLKNLKFFNCKMKSSTIVGIATLPAIDTVEFRECKIDLAIWQSITEKISNSNVKSLLLTFRGEDFNKEFLIHLQQCNKIEQMEIEIKEYTVCQNDLLSFTDLIKLHSLTFWGCIFSDNSQLSFTNCPSLKNLKFFRREMKSSTIVGIATLPAIHTVQFFGCNIDLATWQSITDQISNSNVKYLHLSADFFVEELRPGFLHHLQKCERIQKIHVSDFLDLKGYILKPNEESVTKNLVLIAQKFPALTSITISDEDGRSLDESRRLSETNRERIEKAGQQRNPHFLIRYLEKNEPEPE